MSDLLVHFFTLSLACYECSLRHFFPPLSLHINPPELCDTSVYSQSHTLAIAQLSSLTPLCPISVLPHPLQLEVVLLAAAPAPGSSPHSQHCYPVPLLLLRLFLFSSLHHHHRDEVHPLHFSSSVAGVAGTVAAEEQEEAAAAEASNVRTDSSSLVHIAGCLSRSSCQCFLVRAPVVAEVLLLAIAESVKRAHTNPLLRTFEACFFTVLSLSGPVIPFWITAGGADMQTRCYMNT